MNDACLDMCACLPACHTCSGSSVVTVYPAVSLITDAAGEKFALEAVEVQEDNWQAHKWFAVLTGSGTRFVGTNEKIQRGHKYKVRK